MAKVFPLNVFGMPGRSVARLRSNRIAPWVSRVALLLFAGALLAHGAAPLRTQERLRSLAILPPGSISLQLTTAAITSPENFLPKTELRNRIDRLQAEITAEPNQSQKLLELADYLQVSEQKDQAREMRLRAVKLLRQQAQDRPADAALQVRFADALEATRNKEEAEHVLRQAVASCADDWKAWLGLAEFLARKAATTIYDPTNRPGEPLEKQILALLPQRPTPRQLEAAAACDAEAAKCFDRAEVLAPKQPEIFLSRAVWVPALAFFRNMLLTFTKASGDEKLKPNAIMEQYASAESCALWAKAARLNPTNYAAIGYWGWVEAAPAIVHSEAPLVALTRDRRANVLEAMRMLEQLGDHPNAGLAAGALEALGILRVITSLQASDARSAFRRAVALDPSRSQAWQGLIATAVAAQNNEELSSICEEQLKHDETAQNRIAAAKACVRLNLIDKAMRHARAAVTLAPDDPAAQICVAAVLIRQSQADTDYSEINQHLIQAAQRVKTLEDKEQAEKLTYAGTFDTSIVLALMGETDQARKMLELVSQLESLDEEQRSRIKELQSVIGN